MPTDPAVETTHGTAPIPRCCMVITTVAIDWSGVASTTQPSGCRRITLVTATPSRDCLGDRAQRLVVEGPIALPSSSTTTVVPPGPLVVRASACAALA
jgi:hypothetical protein